MFTIEKSSAEEQVAASQRKHLRILEEKETMRQEKAEKVAHLRTLRLAKEAADKKA
ncbi:MAG: hypothetical protein KAR80_08705 [Rhodospirillaceae bacterium]|nr:hypothetical protein [Rhodospirillaceae bacterium]